MCIRDSSILVQLAEYYDVEMRELLDGERSQTMKDVYKRQDVTGVCELPEGTEMCMPGDNVEMTIELIHPCLLYTSNKSQVLLVQAGIIRIQYLVWQF